MTEKRPRKRTQRPRGEGSQREIAELPRSNAVGSAAKEPPPAEAGAHTVGSDVAENNELAAQTTASEKEMVDAARAAGTDSSTVFVFVPRQAAYDPRKWIIEAETAHQTVEAKGVPTTREGEEAKQSMESRHNLAIRQREELIKQIVANAKVFQGGGAELLQLTLEDRVREAANAALVRLFPRFKEADSAAWETVIKRARDGADQPFQPVGHGGPTEQHPVCQQVLSTIGAGKIGGDVRKVDSCSRL